MAFKIFGIGMGLFLLGLLIWMLALRIWKGPAPRPTALPPLSPEEAAAFIEWHARHEVPVVRLSVAPGPASPNPANSGAGGCRLGGPAWLDSAAQWPRDRSGEPMLHLAQIDFAAIPPLPDFPASGLLQFFVAADDYGFGCDFDDPLNGDIRILWQPSPSPAGGWIQRPVSASSDTAPLGPDAAAMGRMLVPTLDRQRPGWSADWSMRDQAAVLSRTSGALDSYWDAAEMSETHHIGGYPDFVQSDFRSATCCPDHDVVLLQLWSVPMDDICWGDVGQANFMIRRADLAARDFSKVSYQWDCY